MIFDGIDQEALTSHSLRIPRRACADATGLDVVRRRTMQGPPGAPMVPERLDRVDVTFPLLPVHVEYHQVLGFYLPNAALREVANFREVARWADAETAVARRYLAIFLPGVFAFLGASLSQAGRSGRLISWWRLLSLGAFGYVTLVSVKSFWALGEAGVLAPWISAGAPLLFAFLFACLIQAALSGHIHVPRRRGQAS